LVKNRFTSSRRGGRCSGRAGKLPGHLTANRSVTLTAPTTWRLAKRRLPGNTVISSNGTESSADFWREWHHSLGAIPATVTRMTGRNLCEGPLISGLTNYVAPEKTLRDCQAALVRRPCIDSDSTRRPAHAFFHELHGKLQLSRSF